MFAKRVIILSFGVCVGPKSSQTARGERLNPENTPRLRQEARSTLKYGLKQDFLALKVEEHHSSLFFTQVIEPIYTSFGVKFDKLLWVYTIARFVRTNISLCTCSMIGAIPFGHKFKKI